MEVLKNARVGLRQKSTIVLIIVLLMIVAVSTIAGSSLLNIVVEKFANDFATRHVMWQKERLGGIINKELTLSLKLANSQLLQRWSFDEENQQLKTDAIRELEQFRELFSHKTLFAAFNKSLNYYHDDEKN